MVISKETPNSSGLSFMRINDFKKTIRETSEKYFSLIKKYLPSGSLESSVGLDIGARRCKAVELTRTQKGFKILNWVTEPIQNGDTASCLKKILEKIGQDSREIYTAISGQGTLIRFIKMPRMPMAQLKDSLRLEADKYFPFPSSDIYMDCQILEDDKIKDNKMAIMVAVAKKDIIKERLSLLSSLNLQNHFVGLNAVAISNAVIEFQNNKQEQMLGKEKEAFAMIDIGETKTTVVIFRDHAPRFTREIGIGGKDLTQKIMGLLGCNLQQAEELKAKPGDRSDEIFSACQPVLLGLVSEIRLSFDYFSSEDGSQVSKLFLTGNTADFAKTKDFFAKELEVSADIWKPSVDLEFAEHLSPEAFFANINQLSIALGLSVTHND
jgi:type IV pilus assembly protein PilM